MKKIVNPARSSNGSASGTENQDIYRSLVGLEGFAGRCRVSLERSAIACAVTLGLAACQTLDQTFQAENGIVVLTSSRLPLYVYAGDKLGLSKCDEVCTRLFKPVVAPSTLLSPRQSKVRRLSGDEQLAYDGRPLYTFDGDVAGARPLGHLRYSGWLLFEP